jgi:hypothetical protein
MRDEELAGLPDFQPEYVAVSLPSGGRAHVRPDASPETLAALDHMVRVVREKMESGEIPERAFAAHDTAEGEAAKSRTGPGHAGSWRVRQSTPHYVSAENGDRGLVARLRADGSFTIESGPYGYNIGGSNLTDFLGVIEELRALAHEHFGETWPG